MDYRPMNIPARAAIFPAASRPEALESGGYVTVERAFGLIEVIADEEGRDAGLITRLTLTDDAAYDLALALLNNIKVVTR